MTLKKFIYALGDPRTGEIYYIGASKNPVKRLYDHCNDPASSAWLRSKQIKESGLMPVLVVLEEQYTAEREYELIREFLKYGSPLTNSFVSASRSPLARSPLARPPLAARAGLEHTDRSLDFATRRRLLDEMSYAASAQQRFL